ncbi:MAG: amidophosphoribosyltransferase [Clostridia bacterium]|nr:amidophosphoribosyltransferase [Clostridia bacterium]
MENKGLHEECGVFGIYSMGDIEKIAHNVYYGLYALQHRGQQSCGIAVSDRGVVESYKEMGLVGEVFNDDTLNTLKGQMAIGHVRYSKASESNNENSQPLVLRYSKGRIAISHNGSLTNAEEIRNELSHDGAMFQTQTDAELIAHIIAHQRLLVHSVEEAVINAMKKIEGAYSILVMSPQKLVAARDPLGFRPLMIGKKGESYVFASESTALDAISAEYIRDIEPGEVVVVDKDGLKSYKNNCTGKRGICIFEYIYFARPDSTIDGVGVHDARLKAGEILARRHPADADMVIGVPDSGLDAAIGYAKESGLPYGTGFVRNNYIGRTFIKPKQSERRKSIDIKLHVIEENVSGKKIVMVDDSIVRGSTCANIIRELKEAGAAEVHVRIASPTIHWPCYYGTDIPTREELTANHNTVDELCEIIGADSLGFLANEDLYELMQTEEKTFCDACFTGNYPTEIKE